MTGYQTLAVILALLMAWLSVASFAGAVRLGFQPLILFGFAWLLWALAMLLFSGNQFSTLSWLGFAVFMSGAILHGLFGLRYSAARAERGISVRKLLFFQK